MKILHIISGLKSGGAEGVMYRLIDKDSINTHSVISLTDGGFYGQQLKKKNIFLKYLYFKKNIGSFITFFKLLFIIKKINPDIIQCWMYHGDFLGGLAARLLRKKKIYWNLRNSDLNLKWANKTTIFLAKLNSLLSYILPYKIISCSNKSLETHLKLGYCKKKIVLIDNGFDSTKFNFKKNYKKFWKTNLNIKERDIIFCFVGRWNSQKDFQTLFYAFRNFLTVKKKQERIKLLLIGKDINFKNKNLKKELTRYKLSKNILLINETDEVNKILNVVDIGIFSSKGNEGFPNVIAEKMLTKIPCIVSDVGDAARIVGRNGLVYKKNNWIDLSKKMNIVYNQFFSNHIDWKSRKYFSREKIKDNFSLKKMIKSYQDIWVK